MTDTTYGILRGPYPPFDMTGDAEAFTRNRDISEARWRIDASNTVQFYKENPLQVMSKEPQRKGVLKSHEHVGKKVCPACRRHRARNGACECP